MIMVKIVKRDSNIYLAHVMRKWTKFIFISAVMLVTLFLTLGGNPGMPVAKFYLLNQDISLLTVILGCWLLCSAFIKDTNPAVQIVKNAYEHYFRSKNLALIWIAGTLGLVCYAGHYFLLGGYANSRDEQMAVFDSQVFVQGLLISPIDSQWRAFAPALNKLFMMPLGNNEAWISAYLPVNAAFRAIFDCIGDAALTGPFYVVTGALALWIVTKQLWPDQNNLSLLCMVLYAGSGQIIFNGMTSYAMSGHLALNLVWLSLFLANKKRYDVIALAVGFLATGLHQPLFHPLFAAPILSILVLQKNWSRTFIYLAGYAAISAFWLYWPLYISSLDSFQNTHGAGSIDYLSRLQHELTKFRLVGIILMATNLLRFLAWQHILLLPLISIGLRFAWKHRDDRGSVLFLALGAGFLLPVIVMAIILPDQVNGWGYRYIHGVIGNGILLAALGWRSLGNTATKYQTLLASSLATFFLMLPIQAYAMHNLYAPFAQIDRKMNESVADLILIDTDTFVFALDLVFNLPDIDSKPVRFIASAVKNDDFVRLCNGNKALMGIGVEQTDILRTYWQSNETGNPKMMASKIIAARKAGCRIVAY